MYKGLAEQARRQPGRAHRLRMLSICITRVSCLPRYPYILHLRPRHTRASVPPHAWLRLMFRGFIYMSLHDASNPFSNNDIEAVLPKVTVALGYHVSGMHTGNLVETNAMLPDFVVLHRSRLLPCLTWTVRFIEQMVGGTLQ